MSRVFQERKSFLLIILSPLKISFLNSGPQIQGFLPKTRSGGDSCWPSQALLPRLPPFFHRAPGASAGRNGAGDGKGLSPTPPWHLGQPRVAQGLPGGAHRSSQLRQRSPRSFWSRPSQATARCLPRAGRTMVALVASSPPSSWVRPWSAAESPVPARALTPPPAASSLQFHSVISLRGDLDPILLFPFVPCRALSGFICCVIAQPLSTSARKSLFWRSLPRGRAADPFSQRGESR